ncbi:hemolysin family protein [Egicoccus halophilus]|uniref:Membrane protein n=1 Tax=Egicoccus halophilus TaxID=1670830 RepID=A0A8J3EV23_9ACTN|nr:hemolysin family protein [Egicoccus halophilus]GGI08320.1 membrane protein [Egicoccus halophilus]
MTGALALLLVVALIVANGLFVAIEFALVSLRRPVVEDAAETGDRRARMVVRELSQLSFALSTAQFGITATSLILGYVAEQAIGDTLIRPLLDAVGIPQGAALGVSVALAFLLSTMAQMVLGELFPKNLAISRPLEVARAVVPVTRAFGIVLGPVIRVFDRSAESVSRWVFRVDTPAELEGGHSLDELARIISASGAEGSLTVEQTELLRRAVALGDTRVGEVMVPRPDVRWLAADDTLADLRQAARRTGHSRFPVHTGNEDDVLGTVHVKDLLQVATEDHATTPLRTVVVPALAVPESEPLRRLITDLRREQRTFALAIDEYGGTAGIVTVEDVLEQLVGDIEDEFDRAGHDVRRVGAGRHLVKGSLRIERLDELFGVPVPDGEYETIAGFVLDRLGHIPEPGERVALDDWELSVTRVEGVRITELALRRPPGGPAVRP